MFSFCLEAAGLKLVLFFPLLFCFVLFCSWFFVLFRFVSFQGTTGFFQLYYTCTLQFIPNWYIISDKEIPVLTYVTNRFILMHSEKKKKKTDKKDKYSSNVKGALSSVLPVFKSLARSPWYFIHTSYSDVLNWTHLPYQILLWGTMPCIIQESYIASGGS